MENENKYHLDLNFQKQPKRFGDVVLIQLGRRHLAARSNVPTHAHGELFELTAVTDGEGTVSTNGVALPVKKGDIYLSFPGDFHEICSSDFNPLKYEYFAFHTTNEKLKTELYAIVNEGAPFSRRIFSNERIFECIAIAISELSESAPFFEEITTAVFNQILFELVRTFRTTLSPPRKKRSSKAEELCYQIMYYIDTHVYSIEKLTDLSGVFSYHYAYLSTLFKKSTGDSLQNYYQTRRLETAKLLIGEGKIKIVEIAAMLQYSSLYAFSKAFKHAYGLSPREYKESQ